MSLMISVTTISSVAAQSMCEEGLKSFLKSCETGYQKCTVSMPERTEICEDIYFNCTQKADDWYNECVFSTNGNL